VVSGRARKIRICTGQTGVAARTSCGALQRQIGQRSIGEIEWRIRVLKSGTGRRPSALPNRRRGRRWGHRPLEPDAPRKWL